MTYMNSLPHSFFQLISIEHLLCARDQAGSWRHTCEQGSLYSHGTCLINNIVQFSSVAQSCPTLCNPIDCSTPVSITNSRSLLKLMSIELVMLSNHLILNPALNPHPQSSSCPQSFPVSGSFQMSQLFVSVGQSSGVSASTSVLPMNTQEDHGIQSH